MSGFYLMARGWQDHPIFSREEFSRRDAWVWLIENAAFKATKVRAGGRIVDIGRGQLCFSLRFMAKAWGWDDPKVRRYLKALQNQRMIVCVADAGQTVITVCNYDEYQVGGCVGDAPRDTDPTQQRRSSDAKKNEGKEEDTLEPNGSKDASDAASAAPDPVDPRKIIFVDLAGWIASETGRPIANVKSWLGKQCRLYGDGTVIDVCARIRAGPYENDFVSRITGELKRKADNGRTGQAARETPDEQGKRRRGGLFRAAMDRGLVAD